MGDEDKYFWADLWGELGLEIGGNNVWCLVIVVILWDFEEQRGRGRFKIIILGGRKLKSARNQFFWGRWVLTMS